MSGRSTWINPEQAREAMQIGTGRGVKVAIVDSGVELSHRQLHHLRLVDDLAVVVNQGSIKISIEPGHGKDVNGHGTAVAHIIRRVAPDAQIGSFRVLRDDGRCKMQLVGEAVRIALDRGYNIINCSLGIPGKYDHIGMFKPWVDEAYMRGVHIVAACSNEDFRRPEWPACFSSVISVNMAKTQENTFFYRVDPLRRGEEPHLVEFAAKGVDVEIATKDSQMKRDIGSSFAAPHIAALLARLLSVYPGIKPLVAKSLLQEAADPWTPELAAPNEHAKYH
jgi:subtilisin